MKAGVTDWSPSFTYKEVLYHFPNFFLTQWHVFKIPVKTTQFLTFVHCAVFLCNVIAALFDNRHVGCPQVFPLTDKSGMSVFLCVFPKLDSSDCLCWIRDSLLSFFIFLFFFLIFIYLAASGFSCGTWDLQSSLRRMWFSSLTRDWTLPPALGAWSLSPWTSREDHCLLVLMDNAKLPSASPKQP